MMNTFIYTAPLLSFMESCVIVERYCNDFKSSYKSEINFSIKSWL